MSTCVTIKKKRNRESKKAQVTIFFVLGIVIMIVFGLLLFLVTNATKTKIRIESQKALHTFIETSSVEHYITACLEQVSDDAIEKIALQGGIIYDYQGGNYSTQDYILGENYAELNISNITLSSGNPYSEKINFTFVNVSLGMRISNNTGEYPYLAGSFKNPPAYPKEAPSYYLLPNSFIEFINGLNPWPPVSRYEGLYGEIVYPKLCNLYSECQEHSKRSIYNNLNLTTIQDQFEFYLENNMDDCVNISRLQDKRSYNVTTGNISARISFSIDSLSVELDYPVILTWPKGEPVSKILKFQEYKNVRIGKIYELIYSILKHESFDIFFDVLEYKNISRTSLVSCSMIDGSRCFDNQITVNKIKNIQDENDLIVIKDNASVLQGKPLIFNFLIQNRRPALDFINKHVSDDINIVVFNNMTIYFDPKAYDPDSDVLGYKYDGWRADYYTNFDIGCWYPGIPDPLSCQNLTQILDYNHWQTSQSFLSTFRNATYTTNLSDLGMHTVRLTTWDSEGLEDWQDINILVRDFPTAVASGYNEYDDIDNTSASVEDAFILDATESYVMINDPYNPISSIYFQWTEYFDPLTLNGITDAITILPQLYNNDIYEIFNHEFKNSSFLPGEKNRTDVVIKLETGLDIGDGTIHYGEGPNSVDTIYVDIFQCLPHRNTTLPEPFPYSLHFHPGTDPFQANHSCCFNGTDGGNWGEVKGSANDCFNIEEYSSYLYFEDNLRAWYDGFINETQGGGELIDNFDEFQNDLDYQNDIFLKIFSRACDGTRGNICQGDVEVIYSNILCYDDMPVGQIAKCVGPPITPHNYFDSAFVETTVPSCKIYNPGDTFSEFNGSQSPTGNHFCRTVHACYNSTDINNFMRGRGGQASNVFSTSSVPPNTNLIYCVQAKCSGGTTENTDTGNCQYTTGIDCYCNSACNGDPDCNGEDPGHSFSNSGIDQGLRNEKGCLIGCSVIECENYSFDPTYNFAIKNFECHTSCTNDDQCDIDHSCDVTFGGRDCVECDGVSQIQTTGSHNPNWCEEGCGASSQCDERPIGDVWGLNICDSTCQITTCVIKMGNNPNYDHNIPFWTGTYIECDCNSGALCSGLYTCNATGICEPP